MKGHKKSDSLTKKSFSKKVIKENKEAIKAYEIYKETEEQINAFKEASGKRIKYKTSYTTTLDSKLNLDEIESTKNIQINTRLA
jgi:hypothetical protein